MSSLSEVSADLQDVFVLLSLSLAVRAHYETILLLPPSDQINIKNNTKHPHKP